MHGLPKYYLSRYAREVVSVTQLPRDVGFLLKYLILDRRKAGNGIDCRKESWVVMIFTPQFMAAIQIGNRKQREERKR